MNMNTGYCELNCTLCGQVCPTGALQRMTIAAKRGIPDGTAVKIGTAFVDRSRCIPWSLGRDCLVCQEVCPVSPKAIYDIEGTLVKDGEEIVLRRPQVDPGRCIGCGLCQHECPVHDKAAIRVTSAGETRSPEGGFYL
jgi:formate hydrogenlyase subunit 6/NADH:ubiquinone oxidoreductase subunit I